MKSITPAIVLAAMTAYNSSAATVGTFEVDPLDDVVRSFNLDKFESDTTYLVEAVIRIEWSFVNLVEGLDLPLETTTQTGLTNNDDISSADVDLNSIIFADIVDFGVPVVDGLGQTNTSVQTLTPGDHFDFDAEDAAALSGVIEIVVTGSDLDFFNGPGTFELVLDIDGGWDVVQAGLGGQGTVMATFDSAIAGNVEVMYTAVPTPSSAVAALIGLGGVCMRRRRK